MVVTATEMKANFGKYLSRVGEEEIIITKNGKKVAELVPSKMSITDSLIGILKDSGIPEDIDAKQIRQMRLEEKYGDSLR